MTDYSHIVTDDHRVIEGNTNGGTPYDKLHIEINEDGVVSMFTRYYVGGDGVPITEWHKRDLVYTVAQGPAVIALDALRADLAEGGKLSVLIDRIKAGHETEFDGSNMVGRLSADADLASRELEEALNGPIHGWGDAPYIDTASAVWDEEAYLHDSARSEITGSMTNDEIDAWLAEVRGHAPSDGVVLQGDATDWLRQLRDEKRAAASEEA